MDASATPPPLSVVVADAQACPEIVALVLAAHVAGETTGLLRGAGDSPRHMR